MSRVNLYSFEVLHFLIVMLILFVFPRVQATLGSGSANKKSIVQCKVGDKEPIYLCSLLPKRLETCPLNLEFEEDEDVTFLVIGSHNVHLSGFFYGGRVACCDPYPFDPICYSA